MDVSKPLKIKIKYLRDGSLYKCFIDYENITNICYGWGSHNHKFDICSLNSKSVSFKVERLQDEPQNVEHCYAGTDGKSSS